MSTGEAGGSAEAAQEKSANAPASATRKSDLFISSTSARTRPDASVPVKEALDNAGTVGHTSAVSSEAAAAPAPAARAPGFAHRMRWVGILYFAQGYPFGVFREVWAVFFRTQGVSLTDIGKMELLGIPWVAKPLWAPLVDRYGDRRHWISGSLLVLAATLAMHSTFEGSSLGPFVWGTLFVFTLASATQDIAIDAHTINFLEKGEEGAANGLRVSAYRVAVIVAGGFLVALAGYSGWSLSFWIGGSLLLALAILVLFAPRPVPRGPFPPAVRVKRTLTALFGIALIPALAYGFYRVSGYLSSAWSRSSMNAAGTTFVLLALLAWPAWLFAKRSHLDLWFRKPASVPTILFVLLYKLGDQAISPMIKPFWVDRGLTLNEIAWISTTLGVAATIVGALAGGLLTTRIGLIRGLLVTGVFQLLSNLVYALVATLGGGKSSIYAAGMFESFTQGLGTAAFLALLMRLCDKEYAATQYALLSALFSLVRHLSGAASGWATDTLGYGPYFLYTAFLALPAFALLPWVGRRVATVEK